MKKITWLLFAALTFGFYTNAQTVDEIIAKHIEMMGGKDKIEKLKTVKMTGGMNVQGTDVGLTITKSQAVGVRMDLDINGSSNYQLANAKEGWSFMPVMGMADPTKMNEEQFKGFSTQMDVQGALFNYKEKGSTVVLDGTEKVDGSEAYKLKITYKNGESANFFIDKKTSRLVKTSGKTNMQGQDVEIETTFNDYKQNTDGYWFPYAVTNMQGTITFDKIETNIPVDEKLFAN